MRGIMHFEEFKKLSEEDQKKLLIEWRSIPELRNSDIAKLMGLPPYKYHALCSRLNLPRKRIPATKDRKEAVEELKKSVLEVSASTAIVPVVHPDVLVYFGTVPEEASRLDIRVNGYEIVGVIVCNNPEHVQKVRDMSKLFSHDNVKQVFGEGNLVTVLYKRLDV